MTTSTETASSRRPRVGVFVEWLADGYSDPILNELAAIAGEHACDVVCFVGGLTLDDYPNLQSRVPLSHANRHSIDAALIVSLGSALTANQVAEVLRPLAPMPMVSMAVQWSQYPRVDIDNQTGVRRGVRHLIEKHGRRRIACVRGPENSTEADLRFDAYRETLEQEGVPFEPRLLATGAYVRQDGAAAVSNWLDVEQLSFDAVVAANDAMALGVIDELKRRGIAVPEEVGVIGFDDIGEARHCRPALTTVRQPMREHARAAFGVLWDQLQGKKARQKTNLGSKLVVRRSCGCMIQDGVSHSAAPQPPASIAGESDSAWAARLLAPLFELLGSCNENPDDKLVNAFLTAVTQGDRQLILDLLGQPRGRNVWFDTLVRSLEQVSQVFSRGHLQYHRRSSSGLGSPTG